MEEEGRTRNETVCLLLKCIDGGRTEIVRRCARLDECRREIERGASYGSGGADQYKCPGYVADERAGRVNAVLSDILPSLLFRP